jgi:hypothetical protein
MSTTTETQFVTLQDALGTTNAIKRIMVRRQKSTIAKPIVNRAADNMIAKLSDCHGELLGSNWSASYETCKQLGYATILVTIEEAE